MIDFICAAMVVLGATAALILVVGLITWLAIKVDKEC